MLFHASWDSISRVSSSVDILIWGFVPRIRQRQTYQWRLERFIALLPLSDGKSHDLLAELSPCFQAFGRYAMLCGERTFGALGSWAYPALHSTNPGFRFQTSPSVYCRMVYHLCSGLFANKWLTMVSVGKLLVSGLGGSEMRIRPRVTSFLPYFPSESIFYMTLLNLMENISFHKARPMDSRPLISVYLMNWHTTT